MSCIISDSENKQPKKGQQSYKPLFKGILQRERKQASSQSLHVELLLYNVTQHP